MKTAKKVVFQPLTLLHEGISVATATLAKSGLQHAPQCNWGGTGITKKDGEIDNTPAASWPTASIDDAHLLDAVPLASKRFSPVFNIQNRTVNGQSSPSMLIAFPLLINEQFFAIIAV